MVFCRGEGFNPKIDPIVRVQARNVRARLQQYYVGPGARDPVIDDRTVGFWAASTSQGVSQGTCKLIQLKRLADELGDS
jgi:hypothetical protein